MFEFIQLGFIEFLGFCGFIKNQRFKEPLTKQQEAEYLQRLTLHDENARNALIEHNLRLVAHIVKKYDIKKIDKDDLISIGTIGLIKAIDTYKLDSGHKLTTYAARCIENEILSQTQLSKMKYTLYLIIQNGKRFVRHSSPCTSCVLMKIISSTLPHFTSILFG